MRVLHFRLSHSVIYFLVLFYVNEDAVRNIMQELFDYSKSREDGKDSESMLCFTGMSVRKIYS